MASRKARGFTLIELLIVIIILGILAGVLIGLVTNAAKDSRKAGTQETVRETQQAIEMYKVYTGRIPDLITNWDAITTQTSVGGVPIGPFVNREPINLVAVHASNPSCITDGDDPVLYSNVCTFMYDYDGGTGTGRFIAAYETGP